MGSTKRVLQGNKVSVEDLLAAATSLDESQEVEVSTDTSDVLSFVMAYGLKPGDYQVTNRLLYSLYRHWAKNPISRQSFAMELGKYIIPDSRGYHFVDRPAFKVSQEVEKYLIKSTRSATKVKSYKRHFDNYLKKYSLKPGDYYIETFVLYYLYDKWTYGIKKKRPLGQNQFTSLCELYFKKKRNNNSRVMYFGIDRKALFQVITLKQIVNIRNGRRKRYGRKKQPKNPKEVPSS